MDENSKSMRAISDATRLAEFAKSRVTLSRTPDDEAFASFQVRDHQEHWTLRSSRFRKWLVSQFFEHYGKAPSSQALDGAIRVLEGQALHTGSEHSLDLRKAYHDGRLFLDLADSEWRVVEVNSNGWELPPAPPVFFRRARGVQTLPIPVEGGVIDELRPFLNLASEDDLRLIVAWLLAALGPDQPYPVLCLSGEQGSAKSTTALVLRRLVDPNEANNRRPPKEPRDLYIAARNGAVVVLDNLSRIPRWLSDDLCSLSSGGGFSTRELHTDNEEVIFTARRPVILNGIGTVVTASDLLDRSLLIRLPVIPPDRRRDETTFWAEFDAARPRILGALLTAAAAGLRNLESTRLDRLPRLADFARWVTACEEGLGWERGAFLEAFWRRQCEANAIALDATPIGRILQQFVEEVGEWKGSCGHLLQELCKRADQSMLKHRDWPGTPEAVAHALERIAPNLRREGIEVEKLRNTSRGRQIRLVKQEA